MTTGNPQTLAELGEFGLIAEITAAAVDSPALALGPGDDAALLDLGEGPVVTSLDTLVEEVHFRRSWSSGHDVGRKAVAINVSDIEAMGGHAKALLVGLSAPPETPLSWLRDFAAGLHEECRTAGVVLAGGDTTAAPVIVAAVSVIGVLPPGGRAVRRSGARPGDDVAVCGRLGWSAAGLAALRRGFRSPRAVVQVHRVPEPPYGQGARAAAAGATAMIDVSDGLLADLGHVAAASGVRIDLDPAAFSVADPVAVVASATGVDAMRLVLTGGEDHALAATFPPGAVPEGWSKVGRVLPVEPGVAPDGGRAVLVGGDAWPDEGGFAHFRSLGR